MKKWAIRIVHVLLAVGFLMSGILKLISTSDQIREMFTEPLGYGVGFMYAIGVLEILAAVGLIAGFWNSKLALASSGGLIVLMLGAIFSNLSAGLWADATVPFVYLILVLVVFFSKRTALQTARTVEA